jgi:hypothetical protein
MEKRVRAENSKEESEKDADDDGEDLHSRQRARSV